VWQSFHLSGVSLAGPQDEGVNFQYSDLLIFFKSLGLIIVTDMYIVLHGLTTTQLYFFKNKQSFVRAALTMLLNSDFCQDTSW